MGAALAVPDPETPEKPQRRRFSARYKLDILERAEACEAPGEVGRLLRRLGRIPGEGLGEILEHLERTGSDPARAPPRLEAASEALVS